MAERGYLGEFELMVLLSVIRLADDAYGVPLVRDLSELRGRDVSAGSVYAALERLEAKGLIASEWKASDLNRRAKYYRLTKAGREQLVAEQSKWKLLVKTIARVMRPA